jgi:hypothetical protein
LSYSAPGPERRDFFISFRSNKQEVCRYSGCTRGPDGGPALLRSGGSDQPAGYCCFEHKEAASRERKPDNPVSRAREEIQRISARRPKRGDDIVAVRPPRPEEQSAAAGPPDLDRLFAHEQTRSNARRANNAKLANRALIEVIGDLDHMLDIVAGQLRLAGRGRSRQQVKDAVSQLVATSRLAVLPLREMSDLLDIPHGEVDTVLAVLAKNGGISPPERQAALEQVERLRALLRQAASTKDHSLLDRLLDFIVEIVILVTIAIAATPLGTIAVGDSVIKEVIKAGLIALVAVALQNAIDSIRERRRARNPYVTARAAHAALVNELLIAEGLNKEPAYEGEHTVIKIRLMIRCCAARIASISLAWKDTQQYWSLLDEIEADADKQPPSTLASVRRKLQILTPPSG